MRHVIVCENYPIAQRVRELIGGAVDVIPLKKALMGIHYDSALLAVPRLLTEQEEEWVNTTLANKLSPGSVVNR